jgi:hypothetical protein
VAYNYAKLTVNLPGTAAGGSGLDERIKKEIDNVIDEVVKSISTTLKSVTTSLNAETRMKSIYVPHKDIARYIKAIEDRLNDIHIQAKVMYESIVPLNTMKRSIYDAHSLSYIQSMVGSYGGTVSPIDKNKYVIEAPGLPMVAGTREISLSNYVSSQIAQMNRMYKAGASGIPSEYMKYAEGAQWFHADAFPDTIKSGALVTRPTGILRSSSSPDKSGRRRPYSWGSDFMDADAVGSSGGSGGDGGNGGSGGSGDEDEDEGDEGGGGAGKSSKKKKSSSLKLLGELYLIRKVLHLIYDVVKNVISAIAKQGKEAVQASLDAFKLGLTTSQLVDANRGAAAMGFPTDSFTGAAQGLQNAFGNRDLLDKSKLATLAPIVGNEGIRKITELPSGNVTVLQIMDLIEKSVLPNILNGRSPLGEKIGVQQAAAAYNTKLSSVDPDLAKLIMAQVRDALQGEDTVRRDNARSMSLTEYYRYMGSQVSSGLVQGSTRDAYASVGKEVTELQAFFKYLRDDFLLTLLPLLEDFLREVKSIVINFLPENDKEIIWAQTSKRNQQITQSMIDEKNTADSVSNAALEQFFESKQFSAMVNKSGMKPEYAKAEFKKRLDQRIRDNDSSIPLDFLESFGFDPSLDLSNPENLKKATEAIRNAKTAYAGILGTETPAVMLGKFLEMAASDEYKKGHKELASNFIGLIEIALSNLNNGLDVGQESILGTSYTPSRADAYSYLQRGQKEQALANRAGQDGSTAADPKAAISSDTVTKAVLGFVDAQIRKNHSFLNTLGPLNVVVETKLGNAVVTIKNDKGDTIGSVPVPTDKVNVGAAYSYSVNTLRAGSSGTTSAGPTSSGK